MMAEEMDDESMSDLMSDETMEGDDAMMEDEDDMMSEGDDAMDDDTESHEDETMKDDDTISNGDEIMKDDDMAAETMMPPDWFSTPLVNAQTGESFNIADFKSQGVPFPHTAPIIYNLEVPSTIPAVRVFQVVVGRVVVADMQTTLGIDC